MPPPMEFGACFDTMFDPGAGNLEVHFCKAALEPWALIHTDVD